MQKAYIFLPRSWVRCVVPEHTQSSIRSDAQRPGVQAGSSSLFRWASSRLSLGFSDNQVLQEGVGEGSIRIGEIPAQITGLHCMSLLPYIFSNTALYTEHTAVFRKLILS